MTDFSARLQAALGDAYRLESEMARGGMSQLFLATESSLNRRVVVKVLPPEFASEVSAARFKQEIELAAHLQHPNILPVLSAGSSGDLLYYIMPYVEGESLRHRIQREGSLPIADAARILGEVADALALAHDYGVIHRDIKPENILLEGRHAVLTDFGVSRALSEARDSSRLTKTGMALGTPGYMSPEQASGEVHIDARADVYALAVVGYEMLSGEPPFTGPSAQAILTAHLSHTPRRLRTVRADTPPGLEAAIARALAKLPAERFQTAAEFRDAIGLSVAASGTPLRESPWRKPWVVAAAIVVLLAGGAGAALLKTRGGGASRGRPMLVVLPFENLGTPDDQTFADGMTEELTTRLGRLEGLGVIARTSANQYRGTTKSIREIGGELRVGFALEGAVRWQKTQGSASRVRISPRLIRISDGTELWSESYDTIVTEVFALQTDIAQRVAGALNLTLLSGEREAISARPTESLEAYEAYVRATDLITTRLQADHRSAISLLKLAIDRDPRFAAAHGLLARTHSAMFWYGYDNSQARLDSARREAEEAIRLAPRLPEGHLAMGVYRYWGHLDYEGALRELAIADSLGPNNTEVLEAISNVRRRQGRWEETIAARERAVTLSPLNHEALLEQGNTMSFLGRWEEADTFFRRASAVRPDGPTPYVLRAEMVIRRTGDPRAAYAALAEGLPTVGAGRLAARVIGQTGAVNWWWGGRLLGTNAEYRELLASVRPGDTGVDSVQFLMFDAAMNQAQGRAAAATSQYALLVRMLEARAQRPPAVARVYSNLAVAYAATGRKQDAIAAAQRAVQLRPMSQDAFSGPEYLTNLALVYAMVGEDSLAVDAFERVSSTGKMHTPGLLRLDPTLQRLRAIPRFTRMLQPAGS